MSTKKVNTDLEMAVHSALETYSNVHRGSGHNSMVTTRLFEEARELVLNYLMLDKNRYTVIFCNSRRASTLRSMLTPGSYQILSSNDLGLAMGVRAMAVRKNALPKGDPAETGGGTTRLISREWVLWAGAPDRFEAGTPAIINAIAFAKALQLVRQFGESAIKGSISSGIESKEILYKDELDRFSGKELLDELRKTLIGRNVRIPAITGEKPYINLDNAASTPTFEPVWEVFRKALHQPAPVQQEIIREVRTICSKFLNAPLDNYDIIFTSNTTEAINLAAESLKSEAGQGDENVIVSTLLEHSSNDLPWRMIPNSMLIRIPIDDEGFIDLKALDSVLSAYNQDGNFGKKRIKIVAVSGASNVLGTCNGLAEISRIVHWYGARLLVDAAQLAAHRKVDMEGWGIDYLTFSAHKVYAPFGTGVLAARKGLLNFSPAELELIRSSGEENAGGIAALGKSLVLLQRIGMDVVMQEEQVLTALALRGMAKIPGLKVFGIKDPDSFSFARKSGVIAFTLQNKMSNVVAKELAEKGGIGTRNGCHCAHVLVKHILGVKPSLERFQRVMLTVLPNIKLPGVARVSLGIGNNEEDIGHLIQVLGKMAK